MGLRIYQGWGFMLGFYFGWGFIGVWGPKTGFTGRPDANLKPALLFFHSTGRIWFRRSGLGFSKISGS